jgi:hypothetical protein
MSDASDRLDVVDELTFESTRCARQHPKLRTIVSHGENIEIEVQQDGLGGLD